MGICLRIESVGVPSPEIQKELFSESEKLQQLDYKWWCESLYLLGNPKSGEPIVAIPKISIPFYGWATKEGSHFVEVDPTEDSFMAARDILFMSQTLAAWSKKYGVDWRLELEGENVGSITQGVISPDVDQFLERMTEPLGIPLDDPIAQSKADEISQKYSDR
jgi:hypothetical protein